MGWNTMDWDCYPHMCLCSNNVQWASCQTGQCSYLRKYIHSRKFSWVKFFLKIFNGFKREFLQKINCLQLKVNHTGGIYSERLKCLVDGQETPWKINIQLLLHCCLLCHVSFSFVVNAHTAPVWMATDGWVWFTRPRATSSSSWLGPILLSFLLLHWQLCWQTWCICLQWFWLG